MAIKHIKENRDVSTECLVQYFLISTDFFNCLTISVFKTNLWTRASYL